MLGNLNLIELHKQRQKGRNPENEQQQQSAQQNGAVGPVVGLLLNDAIFSPNGCHKPLLFYFNE